VTQTVAATVTAFILEVQAKIEMKEERKRVQEKGTNLKRKGVEVEGDQEVEKEGTVEVLREEVIVKIELEIKKDIRKIRRKIRKRRTKGRVKSLLKGIIKGRCKLD
jgi:hypothetical protein